MLARKGSFQSPFSREQSIRWLSWLARKMEDHAQSVFLIEQLQPSWLARPPDRRAYVLASRFLGGIVLGLAALALGQILCAVGGLCAAILDVLSLENRLPGWMTSLSTRWKRVVRAMTIGLSSGIVMGLLNGALYTLGFGSFILILAASSGDFNQIL
jgi:hypothetical protein